MTISFDHFEEARSLGLFGTNNDTKTGGNAMIAHTMTGLRARTQEKAHEKAHDSRTYLLIYGVTYPVFLVAAVALRLMPRHQPLSPFGAITQRSIFAEAKELASASIPMAFMG
jgi:hypothetical protein